MLAGRFSRSSVRHAASCSRDLGVPYCRAAREYFQGCRGTRRHTVGRDPADPVAGAAARGVAPRKAGRRIVLTEAGERYFAMITDEIERITEATGTIRGFRSVTTLVIRATPTLSNKWLLPRLSRFLDAEPNLEVRLDGTNEPTDFNRELVDLEIRHGDGRWPGLFVEGLAEEASCLPARQARRAEVSPPTTCPVSGLSTRSSRRRSGPAGSSWPAAPRSVAAGALRPQPHGDRRRLPAWASR